jgi:hypothetical protein
MLPLISFETQENTKLNLLGSQKSCASKWTSGSIQNGNHG